jgi:hypothetical protein
MPQANKASAQGKMQVIKAAPAQGQVGQEVARLAAEFGDLLNMLAKQRGNEKLLTDTSQFVQIQKVRVRKACTSCAQMIEHQAALRAEMKPLIELPVPNRRGDFLLRMVLAFYPYGFSDHLHQGQPLALPRAAFTQLGRFLYDILGTLPYADLNTDCGRLLSRFPDVADRNLRGAMFAHKASRVLLMKVLIRLLNGFHDLPLAESLFMRRVGSLKIPATTQGKGRAKAVEQEIGLAHFHALCDGLFGEFVLNLQSPSQGDDLESWFGAGVKMRVLDLLESMSAKTHARI